MKRLVSGLCAATGYAVKYRLVGLCFNDCVTESEIINDC